MECVNMVEGKEITRRKFLKVASASGVAVGLSWVTGPYVVGKEAKRPIKIGGPMPYTGRYSRVSQDAINGYKLWAKHINEMGYSYGNEHLPRKGPGLIDGRPVEVHILDDASDPTTGARLMMHLVNAEKVDLLFGAYGSSIAMATRPIIEAAQIPTVVGVASSQDVWLGQKLQWQVQVITPSRDRFAGLEVLCKEAGYNKIAIVYIDDAMPIAAIEGLGKRLKEAAFNVLMLDAYPIGIRDLVPVVRKARDTGAEILAGGGYIEDGILMAKAALSLKWAPKVFWQMTDFAYPDFKNALGLNAAWQCGDTEWLPYADWPGNKEFVKAYQNEFGRDPEWLAACAYAGCQILEEAVKRVGSVEVEARKAIRDLLFSIERDTIFAHYKVEPLGHPDAGLQIGATRMGSQYQLEQRELALRIIYPKKVATAKFVHPFRWEKL